MYFFFDFFQLICVLIGTDCKILPVRLACLTAVEVAVVRNSNYILGDKMDLFMLFQMISLSWIHPTMISVAQFMRLDLVLCSALNSLFSVYILCVHLCTSLVSFCILM